MLIVDADAHVEESEATWEFLDPEFRAFRPVPLTFDRDTYYGNFNAVWLIEGKVFPKMAGRGWNILGTPIQMERAREKTASLGAQTLGDVPARLADMDKMGIDIQVMLPTLFLVALTDNARLEKALCQSYNRFMAQACNKSGGRLRFIAVLPLHDMQATIEVLREAKSLGAVGAMSFGLVWDKPIGDPHFDPLFGELERLALPLIVHFGWGAPGLSDMFTNRIGHYCAGGIPVVIGFYSMIADGVFERFPRLKVGFLEAGCEWLPYILRRMDASYADGRFPALRMKPSEYVRERDIFLACEVEEDIPYVVRWIGEDRLVVASDYPHGDESREESIVEAVERRSDLSPELRRKILSDNPLRLYNLAV